MTIDTGSHILIAGSELLPVNASQMQLIFILMATAAFFRQGLLVERSSHLVRFRSVAGSAIDKPVGGGVYGLFINIERYLLPVRGGLEQLRIAMTGKAAITIESICLICPVKNKHRAYQDEPSD
jgi:hypothetical protein